jgi:spore germination protein Q
MNSFDPGLLMSNRQQQPTSPYGMYGYGTMPGGMPGGMPFGNQPQMFPPQPAGSAIPGIPSTTSDVSNVPGMLPLEQSFIENILRLNKGKTGTFYFTYENNTQWNAKVYRGVIEAAGRDHIIISDPQSGKRYLLLMVNLDWVEFDEPLNYTPFGPGAGR